MCEGQDSLWESVLFFCLMSLRIKLKLSGLAANVFTHSSISPGLFIFNCDNIEILVKVAADGAWDLTHAELYVCHWLSCAQLLAEPLGAVCPWWEIDDAYLLCG